MVLSQGRIIEEKRNNMSMRKVYQQIISANMLSVTVEHNGCHGGDAGHGGYVKVTLKDDGCTALEVDGKESDGVEIMLRGSTERDTFIQALIVILRELHGPIFDLNGPIPYFDDPDSTV
jgi:hypothetical protein